MEGFLTKIKLFSDQISSISMTHDILNLADNLNEDFMKNKELIIQ